MLVLISDMGNLNNVPVFWLISILSGFLFVVEFNESLKSWEKKLDVGDFR